MVQIPRLTTATADNSGISPAVVRGNERPATLPGLPDGVDRGPRTNVVRANDTRMGPAPEAPREQPGLLKRGLGIVGGYSVGSVVGVGVGAALGAGLGPILLLGLLAGVATAKATDNYMTTGRIW